MTDFKKALEIANVPADLHDEALACMRLAKERAKGLLLHKLKVRFLKAGEISQLLPWEAERLVDVNPDLANWDIAPMINITAHGDNGPWMETPEGGRPQANYWLDKDPNSQEYKDAVRANYWCKGEHPRSQKSRKAWYRRNGGEYHAWELGWPVTPADVPSVWFGWSDKMWVKVCRTPNRGWIIITQKRVLGSWGFKTRHGFEVDNVFGGVYAPQLWYPIDGYKLRAPVAWSTVPGKLEGQY